MSWNIEITVKNETPYPQRVRVKKGQVFENKRIGTGHQNVAAANDYTFNIPANTTQVLDIEVLCINAKLQSPRGLLNVTKFQVTGSFQTQQDLWDIMNKTDI